MKPFKLFANKYLDISVFFIIIFSKIIIYTKGLETGYFSYKSILPPVLASILALIGISFLFNFKHRPKFLYFCNFIITLFIIGDSVYFRYFKDVISLPVLINVFQLGAVKSSVSDLVNIWDFAFAIDLLFIIPKVNKYMYVHSSPIANRLKFSFASICLFLSISVNSYAFYSLSQEQPRLLSTLYNKVYIVRKLGSLNYHYLDFYNSLCASINRKIPVSKEKQSEIQTFLQSNSFSNENLKGIAKGKNLIMIQVEALQNFVINKKVNGEEITPNLNKLIGKSSYFDNFYYQIAAGGTSDAEFMTNNSLYPAPSGSAYFLYCGNEFNSMSQNFKSAGYNTYAFHGYTETFWNRNIMYKKMGFDKFYSENDFNIDETIGLGISDKSFLNQTIDKLKSLKEPYYSFLITLSSHFPFDDLDSFKDFDTGEFNGTLLGNYLKSIHYTDEQLGMFFERLKEEGIMKNSVIVLYGDHSAIPRKNESELSKFLNKNSFSDLEWTQLQKVPFVVHFPDESIKGINNICSGEIDVYPTICNLFDLESKNLMGRDLFNSKNGKAIFRDGSFINDKYYYMAQNNEYFDISTGNKIQENDSIKNVKDSYLNNLQYSDEILKHNLLKKFK